MRSFSFVLMAAVLISISVCAFSQAKLPPTPVRDVTEDFFGTKVTDPYRWLENTTDPEV
jgi:Protease II